MSLNGELERMRIDNELSVLIQSSLDVGLYYYDEHKETERFAKLRFSDAVKDQYKDLETSNATIISSSCLPIEKLKESDASIRSVMHGVFIKGDRSVLINRKIIETMKVESFFCRDKEDIKKIISYSNKLFNKFYIEMPLSELKSIKAMALKDSIIKESLHS